MENGLVKTWKHKGRKCVILWVHSHFCAYVETKLKDVSYSQEFGSYETSPDSNIIAHGGLTFAGELEELNDGIYYFGCDYAHSGDYCEGMPEIFNKDFEGNPNHNWTLEEVRKETNAMCKSIIAYEEVYEKYKKAFEKFEKEAKKINDALSKEVVTK